eukprot:4362851-Ditylum_brightwellii.AAC.1
MDVMHCDPVINQCVAGNPDSAYSWGNQQMLPLKHPNNLLSFFSKGIEGKYDNFKMSFDPISPSTPNGLNALDKEGSLSAWPVQRYLIPPSKVEFTDCFPASKYFIANLTSSIRDTYS